MGWFNGVPWVASLSDRGYREEPFRSFIEGKRWRVEPYDGDLMPCELLQNARYGDHRYDAGSWNCEHFACAVQGRPPRSRQVEATMATGLLGFAAFALMARS
jgi:hypothetical protein